MRKQQKGQYTHESTSMHLQFSQNDSSAFFSHKADFITYYPAEAKYLLIKEYLDLTISANEGRVSTLTVEEM